jgi:acetyltransferase
MLCGATYVYDAEQQRAARGIALSIRNLTSVFKPRSVALIGASAKEHSVGQVVAQNLFHSGFEGPILPVNPKRRAIEGVLAYNSVDDLPFAPDLAVIATPPDTVADAVRQLGAFGTRAVVVLTAGFGEGEDPKGKERNRDLMDAARQYGVRIVGPNCVGVATPAHGLNASFAHIAPQKGNLAFVTQSGAMLTAMLDWASPRGIGFSQVVSLGSMSDVDFGDMLDYLADDPDTRAILLYVEAITNARKFISAARAASRTKPVIVIKGGRFAEGAKAASSHTGALAGSDAVYDAVFRRAGMLRVYDLTELFDAAETLATAPSVQGERMSILTNGGGLGVLATDALIGGGGKMAELSQDTIDKLNQQLPATWSGGNPVDIIGDAPGERYAKALETLLDEPENDAILVMNCPVAVADPMDAAQAVVRTLGDRARPVFTAWLGEGAAQEARRLFAEHGIPSYNTPEEAVQGFLHLVRYKQGQDELMETPPSIPDQVTPDTEAARKVLNRVLSDGRQWASEPEAKQVLKAYGVPICDTRMVEADVETAVEAAEDMGYPVVLKVISADITHKSDVGGVELALENAGQVRAAAERMRRTIAELRPDARIEGFSVQQMVDRPDSHELIVGATEDVQFGPVLMFGHGGTAVEVRRDQAIALPPLNMNLAHSMIANTRVHRLLQGYRGQPGADVDAIARALNMISQLVVDCPEVAELDINPLLADEHGVVAVDARIKVQQAKQAGAGRLAIRPYPKELEETCSLSDGTQVRLRPLMPEDGPALTSFLEGMDAGQRLLRIVGRSDDSLERVAARLSQVDYNREMALAAVAPEAPGALLGVVRLTADPDGVEAGYALAVRDDFQNRGLGKLLIDRILAYARGRGFETVVADVAEDNQAMLQACREFGFSVGERDPETGTQRIWLPLGTERAA